MWPEDGNRRARKSVPGAAPGPSRPPPSSANVRRRQSDDDTEDTNKRQRTALACDSCRNRKSRCDGARPSCGSCVRWGFACVYRHPVPATAQASPSSMASMEMRLKMMENMLQQVLSSNNGRAGDAIAIADQGQVGHAQESLTAHVDSQPNVGEDTVDGMGSVTFAGEAAQSFFGPSSNSAFNTHCVRVWNLKFRPGHDSLSKERTATRDLSESVSRPLTPSTPLNRQPHKPLSPFFLPSRAEMLRLVESFFATTGCFFPYIDKNSLVNTVQHLESDHAPAIRRSWLCLLNAVMACGAILIKTDGGEIQANEAQAEEFGQRAMKLSPWIVSNTATLETVQALAVMTQYSEAMSRSAETWRLHGYLVQAAVQMGLHFEHSAINLTPFEQEIRRRTWYMCIILDRMLSSTLGRPPLIPDEASQVPLPTDESSTETSPGHGGFSRLMGHDSSYCELFCATIKLFRILGDIIRELYNQNFNCGVRPNLEELLIKVIALDRKLHDWKQDLSPALRILRFADLSGSYRDWRFSRPQMILTLRYLSAQTLLYRVMLTRYLEVVVRDPHVDQPESFGIISQAYARLCSDSALEILNIIDWAFQTPGARDTLPSWWFTIYYVFQSAMILFAKAVVSVSDVGRSEYDRYDCVPDLHKATAILDRIAVNTRLSRRCSKYLGAITRASATFRSHLNMAVGPALVTPATMNSTDLHPAEASHYPLGNETNLEAYRGTRSDETYDLGGLSSYNTELGQFIGDEALEFFNLLNAV